MQHDATQLSDDARATKMDAVVHDDIILCDDDKDLTNRIGANM
jgi:hypothetical protein